MSSIDFSVAQEDIDEYNHANYSAYLRWYGCGQADVLKEFGGFKGLEQYGFRAVVRHIEVDYLQQLYLHDNITVHTGIKQFGTTSMMYKQSITKGNALASCAEVTMVFIDLNSIPRQIPETIRNKLQKFRK